MKPLKIGLTGGIGSGKTTVANMFHALNIPIYVADEEAKKLMISSKVLIRQLKSLLGENAYDNNQLNKEYIRKAIFNDQVLLNKMNAIVHPKVARHFTRWYNKQTSAYIISESALIFEHKTEANYKAIITVTSPKELRINRVIGRDSVNITQVEKVITNQLADAYKTKNADFVINNIDLNSTRELVLNCHLEILKKIKNT
jgi:dephospho-CoA kinase